MSKIGPYINFQGRAREAMERYHEILGGELVLWALDEKGSPKPAAPGDRISYARLDADGILLVGSDGHPSYPPTVGDNIAIELAGTDRHRLTRIFEQLCEGGRMKGALAPQTWGADAGWLTDPFGVNWVVSIEPA